MTDSNAATSPPTGFHVVIPARYDSSRLPGKPLLDIGNVPMIVRVATIASLAGALDVTVATDDQRIVDVVRAAGFSAELTSSAHQSGSDRVWEVVQNNGWGDEDVVVNVQGDEPLLPPALVAQVGEFLLSHPAERIATLREAIVNPQDMEDPNCVKVVVDRFDSALLFSRAHLPHQRSDYDRLARVGNLGWRHVGLYGYRVEALRSFVSLPPSSLELQESLEQLRLLENGIGLKVLESLEPSPGGVDTQADLERARAELAG